MPIKTKEKDPDATLDYGVDWGPFLATTDGDTIVTAEWQPVVGLTVNDQSVTDGVHKALISGGTLGEIYTVTSRITTLDGRIEDESFRLIIKEN